MLANCKTGKTKKPTTDKCTICNAPDPEIPTTLGASFCETCWILMAAGDEDALDERMVWD
ncbi:hypothetical protein GCM10008933_21610 [Paenibacillus motobuensis]|uniref:Inhibitor of sigma-G Gin n=1 Tax=Paenibacillus motobuensis TaxID=295324 RepID=A0ABP3I5T8_9BACL